MKNKGKYPATPLNFNHKLRGTVPRVDSFLVTLENILAWNNADQRTVGWSYYYDQLREKEKTGYFYGETYEYY